MRTRFAKPHDARSKGHTRKGHKEKHPENTWNSQKIPRKHPENTLTTPWKAWISKRLEIHDFQYFSLCPLWVCHLHLSKLRMGPKQAIYALRCAGRKSPLRCIFTAICALMKLNFALLRRGGRGGQRGNLPKNTFLLGNAMTAVKAAIGL